MHGKCAAVARSNVWNHEVRDVDPLTGDEIGPVRESQDMWDFRIKVEPWQVFGTVELDILGTDIVVEHVWAANVLSMHESAQGVRVKIELDNTPQDDQQFDIDGTGSPSGDVAILGCTGLEPAVNDCKLGMKYSMLNSFEGVISSKITVDTWQEGAKISISFGTPIAISEVWGAQIIDYDVTSDDEEAELVTDAMFRLLPFNHHTPLDRRSSFGFDATPPFHKIPVISCIPSHPLPPPPPPSPPLPPPEPPPFFVTERADCFLGGRITFVTPPSDVPGTLWEVNVKMNHWKVGAQLTLDFFGEQLKKHPLRIKSIEPDGAVEQVTTTPHSTLVQLLDTPVREFNVHAYGMVEGLAKLACCCAAAPSPPPPPPQPPPSPLPPPLSPSPPPTAHSSSISSEWGRGIQGRVTLSSPPPMPPPVVVASKTTTRTTIRVFFSVAVFGIVVLGLQQLNSILRKNRGSTLPTVIGKGGITLVPKPQRRAACLANQSEELEMPITARGSGSSGTTKLHIEISPSCKTSLKISLEGISTMDELQDLVAEVCEEAGYKQLDDLIMTYKRPDGKFATVTRSVTVAMLRKASALRLAPAEAKSGSTKKKSNR